MSPKTNHMYSFWEAFQPHQKNKALMAVCQRIALGPEGPEGNSVDGLILKMFPGFFGPEKWKQKHYAMAKLFRVGMSHSEGITLGAALQNIQPSNGTTAGRDKRVAALFNTRTENEFYLSLVRLIPLDRDSSLKLDLKLLERDLYRFFYRGDSQVRLDWLRHYHTNPPTSTNPQQ